MTTPLLDLRFASRLLRRSPWFASLAVMILALGIGLNTALFSMVDAVLFRALPFGGPDRLVEIWGFDASRDGMRVPGSILDAIRARSTTAHAFMVHGPARGVLQTNDGPVEVFGARVSASFANVFAVAPVIGRSFVDDDDRADAPAVVLVSHAFWQRFLGGDSAAVGRVVQLDSILYTVTGVMPREFRDSFNNFRRGERETFWTTRVTANARQLESTSGYEITARLRPGVSVDKARRELSTIAATVSVERWGPDGRRLGLRGLKDEIVGDSARALQLTLAAVILVLAIVCANLALLMLARSDRREREFATRKALGASAASLLQLAMAESLLLALAGGSLGIALSFWLLPLLLSLAPTEIPRIAESTIDGRVLITSAVTAIATAIAFGLVPALRLTRSSVAETLNRTSSRLSGGGRLRGILVAAQVSGAVVLCVLAGLVGRTFLTLLPSDPGFSPGSVATYLLGLDARAYPDPADRQLRMENIATRITSVPGVSDVAIAENVPFGSDDFVTVVRAADVAGDSLPGERRAVSPNFFALLGMPVLRGRAFSQSDGAGTPRVAVVNQTLARKLGGSDVLGRRVQVGRSRTAPVYEIVGVARDARSSGASSEILNEVYVPARQAPAAADYLVIRSDLGTGQLTDLIRREIRAAAPATPLRPGRMATSLKQEMSRSFARPRFLATLSAAFSATALLLSALGVFGLVAYSVSQRQQELGIRAAMGARPRDLVVTTLGTVITPCVIGLGAGLLLAAYLTRFVSAELHGVASMDAPTFAGAAALLLLVCATAAAIPTRRAAVMDPMRVLRHD